jgi:hypothetical protein
MVHMDLHLIYHYFRQVRDHSHPSHHHTFLFELINLHTK